jgi:hypothetical protein
MLPYQNCNSMFSVIFLAATGANFKIVYVVQLGSETNTRVVMLVRDSLYTMSFVCANLFCLKWVQFIVF